MRKSRPYLDTGFIVEELPLPMFREHPVTGLETPVWTLRKVAQVIKADRMLLTDLFNRRVIPEPLYGFYGKPASPLFSAHQMALIRGLKAALDKRLMFMDGLSAGGLSRSVQAMQREWDNEKERRCSTARILSRWEYELLERRSRDQHRRDERG